MNELLLLLKEAGIDEGQAEKIVESVTGLVSAETEIGKDHYRKKDSEAKSLREEKQALNAILTKLGVDPANTNIDEYLSTREKETTQKDLSLESLKDALESMKNDLQGERDLRINTEKDVLKSKVLAELTSGMGDVYGSSFVVKGIMSDNEYTVGEDGSISIGGKNVNDFVSSFKEANPDIIRTNQQQGTGELPSNVTPVDLNEMSTLEFMS